MNRPATAGLREYGIGGTGVGMTALSEADVAHAPGLMLAGERAPEPRTLIDILRESAAANPQASAIIDADGSLSYRQLMRQVTAQTAALVAAGVQKGDRVGIRIPSGTRTLYTSILATLAAGASYVPVDADDPDERAELVFSEADVIGVIGADGVLTRRGHASGAGRIGAAPVVAAQVVSAQVGAAPVGAGVTGSIPVLPGPDWARNK